LRKNWTLDGEMEWDAQEMREIESLDGEVAKIEPLSTEKWDKLTTLVEEDLSETLSGVAESLVALRSEAKGVFGMIYLDENNHTVKTGPLTFPHRMLAREALRSRGHESFNHVEFDMDMIKFIEVLTKLRDWSDALIKWSENDYPLK